jgi:hypothetical protein
MAKRTNWTMEVKPSLRMMLARCDSTVFTLMSIEDAICLLDLPSASSWTI